MVTKDESNLVKDFWVLNFCYCRIPAITSLGPGKLDIYPEGCIITGCQDSSIRIFDSIGNLLNILQGHEKGVISFSWTSELKLISGSWDGSARIWDLTTGSMLQMLGPHENGVHVLGLPDGSGLS